MLGCKEKICLIIPCYNEAKRINLTQFKKYCSDKMCFIFVDDLSTDHTYETLKKESSNNWHVIQLPSHKGKAEAVRQGVLYAIKQNFFRTIDWIGYWDADLSTPLYEIDNFLTYSQTFYPDTMGIFGSRLKRLGSQIDRRAKRHYLGRVFATLASLMFKISCYDTQCGSKLFKPKIASELFSKPFISQWIFDVEICLKLSQTKIIEYPLMSWKDVKGSKLNVLKTLPMVLLDLIRIYRYHRASQP